MEEKLVFFEYGPGPSMMATDVLLLDASLSMEELDIIAWELAVGQAENYASFYLEGEAPEDEEEDYFSESDLDYYYEDYVPEKHDMLRAGGGSFMEEFKNK